MMDVIQQLPRYVIQRSCLFFAETTGVAHMQHNRLPHILCPTRLESNLYKTYIYIYIYILYMYICYSPCIDPVEERRLLKLLLTKAIIHSDRLEGKEQAVAGKHGNSCCR